MIYQFSFNPLLRCQTSAPGGHKSCYHAMSRNLSTIETSRAFFATLVRSCPFRRPRPTMLHLTEHHRPPSTELSGAKTTTCATRATVICPDRNPLSSRKLRPGLVPLADHDQQRSILLSNTVHRVLNLSVFEPRHTARVIVILSVHSESLPFLLNKVDSHNLQK